MKHICLRVETNILQMTNSLRLKRFIRSPFSICLFTLRQTTIYVCEHKTMVSSRFFGLRVREWRGLDDIIVFSFGKPPCTHRRWLWWTIAIKSIAKMFVLFWRSSENSSPLATANTNINASPRSAHLRLIIQVSDSSVALHVELNSEWSSHLIKASDRRSQPSKQLRRTFTSQLSLKYFKYKQQRVPSLSAHFRFIIQVSDSSVALYVELNSEWSSHLIKASDRRCRPSKYLRRTFTSQLSLKYFKYKQQRVPSLSARLRFMVQVWDSSVAPYVELNSEWSSHLIKASDRRSQPSKQLRRTFTSQLPLKYTKYKQLFVPSVTNKLLLFEFLHTVFS